MRTELIFWEENGEVKKIKEEAFEEYERLRENEEVQKIAVSENGDEFGHFEDVVFVSARQKHGLVIFIERRWVPMPGYSWSEVQVKRIEID